MNVSLRMPTADPALAQPRVCGAAGRVVVSRPMNQCLTPVGLASRWQAPFGQVVQPDFCFRYRETEVRPVRTPAMVRSCRKDRLRVPAVVAHQTAQIFKSMGGCVEPECAFAKQEIHPGIASGPV